MKRLAILILSFSIITLSACQIIGEQNVDKQEENTSDFNRSGFNRSGFNKSGFNKSEFGQYYLFLKSLSKQALIEEIALQKKHYKTSPLPENIDIHMQLILLYSLPNSPIHNPYNAKALLNKLQEELKQSMRVSVTDHAFNALLKDQLNQQLLLFQQLIEKELVFDQNQAELQTQQGTIKSLTENTTKLTQELIQLKQKMLQLKKIEKSINRHGNTY